MHKVYKTKVDKFFNMDTQTREKRLKNIRERLVRGDKKRIAVLAGVHWVWVSEVIRGHGTSERILAIAEEIINERLHQN